jgi:hypothetical protein
MKQCWFVGDHGDVGGGKPGRIWPSNLSLVWMMAHLAKTGADFDRQTLFAFLNPDGCGLSKLPEMGGGGSPGPVYADFSPTHEDKCSYSVESSSLSNCTPQHQPTWTSTRSATTSESDILEKLSREASRKKDFQRGKIVLTTD